MNDRPPNTHGGRSRCGTRRHTAAARPSSAAGQQGERADAAVASAGAGAGAGAGAITLAAATQCKETGTISAASIDKVWSVNSADKLGNLYLYQDEDQTRGTAYYSNAVHGISITAQADGDCAQHGRRLGGLSPWLAYTIGSGLGLTVRLGLLTVLIKYGVSVSYDRPLSEAAGGFVAATSNSWLASGKFTAGTFAAGLFGALTAVTGGHISRAIIGCLAPLPTRGQHCPNPQQQRGGHERCRFEAVSVHRATQGHKHAGHEDAVDTARRRSGIASTKLTYQTYRCDR